MHSSDISVKEILAIGLLFAILALGGGGRSNAATTSNSLTVGNAAPVVSGVTLNGGNTIILTAGATTTVEIGWTLTDFNGCGDVLFSGNATATAYRLNMLSTCEASSFNCYRTTSFVHSCPSATSTQTTANATTTLEFQYFAQATDASSSYPGEDWLAAVAVRDQSGSSTQGVSSPVELGTLLAIDILDTDLSYGTLGAGQTSAGDNPVNIKNAGNASSTIQVSGTALTSGANVIATSSQHYATSTFTYGGLEQVLSAAASTITGLLIPALPVARWTETQPMLSAVRNHASAASHSYIYAMGGSGSSGSTSTVNFARINSTGSLSVWTQTASLATSTTRGEGLWFGEKIYYIGGNLTSTHFAVPSATGSIPFWTFTTDVPFSVSLDPGVAASEEFIYVAGGISTTSTSDVYFASTTSDGSIPEWTQTTSLPYPVFDAEAEVHGGFLYVIGGDIGPDSTSTVLYAPINATGSLGAWQTTTPLPVKVQAHTVLVDNGLLYVFGGSSSGFATSSVYFAPIKEGGGVGDWSSAAPLPSTNLLLSVAGSNGYAYVTGGDGGQITSTVNFSSLPSRNVYWGIQITDAPPGAYSGTQTYTAVYSP